MPPSGPRRPADDGPGHILRLFAGLSGWRPAWLAGDLAAGLMLTAIQLPSQMATAHLAGLPTEYGFYAFIAGGLGFLLLGANRFMSVAGDSTIAPIFAAGLALAATPGSADYQALAATFALMVGAILLLVGLLRMGWVADLMSIPVTTGFFAGIAVHIVVGQLPVLLGVPGSEGHLLARIAALWRTLPETRVLDLAVGAGVLAAVLAGRRVGPRVPGALVGLVAAALAAWWLDLPARGVAMLGGVPEGLPLPALPRLDHESMTRFAPLAAIVALVCMVQTAAVTRSFPSTPGVEPDVAKDYAGVGAGNLLASVFGAFPVDASPPSTAIVAQSGARSQVACLVAILIFVALLLFGTGLLAHVPRAALAGVLMYVGGSLFRVGQMQAVRARGGREFWLMLATLVLIVLLPIETGMVLGIALAFAHGLLVVARPGIVQLARDPASGLWVRPTAEVRGEQVAGVLVLLIPAPLHFTNAHDLAQRLEAAVAHADTPVRTLVLEASSIIDIDYTGSRVLQDLATRLAGRGCRLVVAGLIAPRAVAAAAATGLTTALGPDGFFRSTADAVRDAR